ncbi:MAG: DUF3300 domain-containing protein [Candidatus Competibacteraceae bacterium]|nr:DUF3300 domain-containing protein [Candidatus Competibacteraceae bacterium]
MNYKPLIRLGHVLAVMLITTLAAAQSPVDPKSPQIITEVQTLLNQVGFDSGTPDGVMGQGTTTAISDYQQWAELPVTGRIDDQLVQSLRTNATESTESAALTQEQLVDLVAPIALYPDDLLAIVLPASTFPLEIVQAARFLEKRKADSDLKPSESWDTSVLGLLNYPDVVNLMNNDLDWTEKLGTAVFDQQNDVMEAIQTFRSQAYEAGNLADNEQQVVTQEQVEVDGGTQREVIIIRSANPEVIYVPRYDPTVVIVSGYAGPPPIYYSNPYPYYYSPAATFFTGMFVGAAIGYGFNWGRYDISYNRNVNVNINRPGDWRPNNRPGNSWRPNNRPGYKPGNRPGRPGARPPNRPGARPGIPSQLPAQQPASRPAQRPATRPAQRPASKPAQRSNRNAFSSGGNRAQTRAHSNRGAASRGGARRGGGGRRR